MSSVIQIKRRTGTPGAPATLAVGELAYNDPAGTGAGDALYIGSSPAAVHLLVGASRQLELTGPQTITGDKTINIANWHVNGGANTNLIQTDGAGNLSWVARPATGLTAVTHDTTMTGDGGGTPLSVVHLATARTIGLTATGGTTITVTAASFDGSANVALTGFEVTGLDGGTY